MNGTMCARVLDARFLTVASRMLAVQRTPPRDTASQIRLVGVASLRVATGGRIYVAPDGEYAEVQKIGA